MTERMRPASLRQIEQLVKLHGAQAVLEAVETTFKRFGYLQEYQQLKVVPAHRSSEPHKVSREWPTPANDPAGRFR